MRSRAYRRIAGKRRFHFSARDSANAILSVRHIRRIGEGVMEGSARSDGPVAFSAGRSTDGWRAGTASSIDGEAGTGGRGLSASASRPSRGRQRGVGYGVGFRQRRQDPSGRRRVRRKSGGGGAPAHLTQHRRVLGGCDRRFPIEGSGFAAPFDLDGEGAVLARHVIPWWCDRADHGRSSRCRLSGPEPDRFAHARSSDTSVSEPRRQSGPMGSAGLGVA